MRKQKINIEIIPLNEQRFATLGDYYYDKDKILYFKITDTGNPLFNKLILIHELIEQTLTEAKGIKEESILKHDLEFEKLIEDGLVPADAEPGEHKNSPYRQEHILAETVERLLLNHLNQFTFNEYSNQIFKVFEDGNNQ